MNALELLKMFLQVPELSAVGSSQERAAFVALRIDGHTVREAGQVIGISKSNVKILADFFQAKLTKKMKEMRKKGACHVVRRIPGSVRKAFGVNAT